MDLLFDTLGFAAKGLVVFLTVAAIVGVIVVVTRRRRRARGSLEVRNLNERFEALGDGLRGLVLEPKAFKQLLKARKKDKPGPRPSVYVVDFDGDLLATAVESLREEVSAIVAAASPGDEVVVRLESPGGVVPHYGLAAAQLERLKAQKLQVTVCVDRVAASGGYLVACVADRVVAAPFAVIGSIGVVAQVPNLHRLLKKHDVDYEELTAGEYKRTVSLFGEITDKGREKFKAQLEETHGLFKDFVKAQRPALDVDAVSTGEYWLARRAKDLGLVDELATSDDYLLGKAKTANVYAVHYEPAEDWRERLGWAAGRVTERAALQLLRRLQVAALG